MAKPGYKSDYQLTKDTPYLALTNELWGVFERVWERRRTLKSFGLSLVIYTIPCLFLNVCDT